MSGWWDPGVRTAAHFRRALFARCDGTWFYQVTFPEYYIPRPGNTPIYLALGRPSASATLLAYNATNHSTSSPHSPDFRWPTKNTYCWTCYAGQGYSRSVLIWANTAITRSWTKGLLLAQSHPRFSLAPPQKHPARSNIPVCHHLSQQTLQHKLNTALQWLDLSSASFAPPSPFHLLRAFSFFFPLPRPLFFSACLPHLGSSLPWRHTCRPLFFAAVFLSFRTTHDDTDPVCIAFPSCSCHKTCNDDDLLDVMTTGSCCKLLSWSDLSIHADFNARRIIFSPGSSSVRPNLSASPPLLRTLWRHLLTSMP